MADRTELMKHMTSRAVSAAASGTFPLGDLTVNRIGLGAMA
jgi:hypothetical protein